MKENLIIYEIQQMSFKVTYRHNWITVRHEEKSEKKQTKKTPLHMYKIKETLSIAVSKQQKNTWP